MLPSLSWSFPPFRLDPATGSLWQDAQLVPLPRVHLVRYGGCLAPHSHLQPTFKVSGRTMRFLRLKR
jgi:hypothetical protein